MSGSSIAVVGVGAIGGVAAAALGDLGRHEIVLCVRTLFDSLEVEHPGGKSWVDAAILDDPATAEPVDWVLIATKAHQTPDASPWLRALTAEGKTRWAFLQNGVDQVERGTDLAGGDAGPALSPAGVVPVIVNLPASSTAPGTIVQSLNGMLTSPDDEDGRAFADLFEGSRISVRARPDFMTIAWRKLLMNASLGGVCAFISGSDAAVSDGPLRQFVLDLMLEAVPVARAEGAEIGNEDCERILEGVLQAAPDHWSSIAVDRREGRPMEWEARNAVIGHRGRAHGIPTPMNDALTDLLRAIG